MNPKIKETIEVPETYSSRPTTLNDAEAVGALWETVSKSKGLSSHVDPNDMRTDWQEPKFDLASSSRVVIAANGEIIAYCNVWDNWELPVKPFFTWYVHPEHQAKGIEDYLLYWLEKTAERVIERCPEDAQIIYQTNSNSKSSYRLEFLESIGYIHTRNFHHMVIEMDEAPPKAALPEGIIIRTMRYPDELERIVVALDSAFQDHWGYVAEPIASELEFWQHFVENDRLFDASLYFLAVDAQSDEIAGFTLCRMEQHNKPDVAYVLELGVIREYRRQGIALAMLHHAFAEFWRRGRKTVALNVDAESLTGATRLYEKAGMHPDETWMNFQKVVREGVNLSTTNLKE